MTKDNEKTTPPDPQDTKNPILILYYMAQDWMRPSPKHPLYMQILVFIVKLPAMLLFLTISPILIVSMFITFIAAL